jgi:hypothetical protein
MMGQLEHVLRRLVRVHAKSLGGILTLQERLGRESGKKWSVAELVEEGPAA